MPTLLGSPKCQFFDTNTQEFLIGGNVYSFSAGTNTPIATYPTIADAQALTNANTNPIVLDQRGECNLVISGSTKLVLTDGNTNITSMLGATLIIGNIIWTVDNLTSANADIVDQNNKYLIKFTGVVGAVNYYTITNSITGSGPIIAVAGADPNIDMNINAKGTGHLKCNSPTDITGALTVSNGVTVTGNIANTGNVTVGGTINATSNGTNTALNIIPPGMLGWFAFSSQPSGWLICDGSAVSRTLFSALFAVIGTVYGAGDGSTTFNLPNQARRTLVGAGGAGTGTLGNTVSNTGGTETNTLGSGNMPPQVAIATGGISAQTAQGGATYNIAAAGTGWSANGAAAAVNNIQPSLIANLCIKI